jgi:uncharacterized membrane protein
MSSGRGRIPAIDVLRGLVMGVMVLDHARDFFFGATRITPTDLAHTTPALFFTRWVTHFCAPTFVFLSGTSAFLYGARRSVSDTSRFLRLRGFILVVLELTVVRMCWFAEPFYRFTLLQVIWAIGWSMVLLSVAVFASVRGVAAIGAIIVLLHDLLVPVRGDAFGSLSFLWTLLFRRGMFEPLPGHRVFASYSVIPWFGVMCLGYAFGTVMLRAREERRAVTLRIGLAATGLFVVLRAANLYGDPLPFSGAGRTPLWALMSFLNCEKYPPSLLFTLMTLGPALVLLSFLDREGREGPRPLRVLGSVPLFFYVAHLALLRFTSAPLAYVRFGPSAFKPPPGHAGSPELGLGAVYMAWVAAVLLLYPAAAWFAKKKETSTAAWLKYL